MSHVLSLLLALCNGACSLPLPGHVIEVTASATGIDGCLRSLARPGVRLCTRDLPRYRQEALHWVARLWTTLPPRHGMDGGYTVHAATQERGAAPRGGAPT
ncbi:MAG TPA: hypothetical protein DDZ67_12405 [Xanthomonadaceae bacterium]|nr:hypothetical protein [Xanthomonadaceae bacterium]